MVRLTTLFLAAFAFVPAALADLGYKDYDNDFLDPSYILAKNFNQSTAAAQQTVVQWADFLATQGPWCERLLIVYHARVDLELHFQL